jgi:predicted glycogen debranching enzyme
MNGWPFPAPTRRLTFQSEERRPTSRLEWLVTNGLGGYACGTVAGGITRRYHGMLISALPAPLGRMLYVSLMRASLVLGDVEWVVDHEDLSRLDQPDVLRLVEFRLEAGLPVWRYEAGDSILEKRIFMVRRSNTTIVRYRMDGEATGVLKLMPLIHVRPHDAQTPVVRPDAMRLSSSGQTWHLEVDGHAPPVDWTVHGAVVRADFSAPLDAPLEYLIERERGYAHAGLLWYPGAVHVTLGPGQHADIVFSTEGQEVVSGIVPDRAQEDEEHRRRDLLMQVPAAGTDPMIGELVLAADQFLILPASRRQDLVENRPAGEGACTVIAGYHWFTDWGRDTMISLEGLTLCTGRAREAAAILRTFARHVRDGLIPNLFPEGEQQGLYHTADATLWFFHAVDRYVTYTGDRQLLLDLLPVLTDSLEHHLHGTRFGIGVDPADGLLTQGAPGYQLTWMDAKVGEWVVTPRRGKTVEINALWYNALRLAEGWHATADNREASARYGQAAERVFAAFNSRFWNPASGHLFDVIDGEDGDDPACRPNQLLAISLTHPVLATERWAAIVGTAERVLLTPVGLRSLAPSHPDYRSHYFGDLHARDAAYHQGTVWAWLIGPFADAWRRVHPDDTEGVRRFWKGFESHMAEACVGTIAEIFDADEPFTPRGCVAQAWSVAEVLRLALAGPAPQPRTLGSAADLAVEPAG